MNDIWRKLIVSKKDLQLIGTLNGGQSFRWKKIVKNGEELWIGVFSNLVWILKQNEEFLEYQVKERNSAKRKKLSDGFYENLLKTYFRLDVNLPELYTQWSQRDPVFKKASADFYGIRMLNQDPVENLFSFICSQNNHITRISSLVEKLCSMFGEEICEVEDTKYYSFPQVEALAGEEVEAKLRKAGFGYRAKYINKSAGSIVDNGGINWFKQLKNNDYLEAKRKLCELHGIGAKVADCICLMSLGHLEAVPIDTHVYKIASVHYLPHLANKKTVTDKMYTEIGNYFRELFGESAGWAHTVLFCADLKKLQGDSNSELITLQKKSKLKKKSNGCDK